MRTCVSPAGPSRGGGRGRRGPQARTVRPTSTGRRPCFLTSELQPCLTRRIGERFDPAVVKETAAVEHDLAEARRLRLDCDRLAYFRRLPDAVALGLHLH